MFIIFAPGGMSMRNKIFSGCHAMDKVSRYLRVKKREDKTLLFNILKGEIALTRGLYFNPLQKGFVTGLPNHLRRAMQKWGMLVSPGKSEVDAIKQIYVQHKSSGAVLCFTLTPSYRCNCVCPACFQKEYNHKSVMDDTISDAIVALVERQIESKHPSAVVLWLYGGEPFLHAQRSEKLVKAIRSICQRKSILSYVYCATNGTLLDNSLGRSLSCQVDHFYLSISQSEAAQHIHRPFKNGRNSYTQVLNGCRYLAKKHKQITLRINISDRRTLRRDLPILLNDLMRVFDGQPYEKICFEFSALNQQVQHCFLEEETARQNSDRDERMYAQIHALIHELLLPWDKRYFNLPVERKFVPIDSPSCGFERCGYLQGNHFFIAPDGAMYMCNITENKPEYRLGNVTNFNAVLANRFYERVQSFDLFSDAQCSDCVYLPLCLRDCPLHVVKAAGRLRRNGCRTAKKQIVDAQIDLLWHHFQQNRQAS